MPNIKSAIKRVKINEKRRSANAQKKSAMRTAVKNFEALAAKKDIAAATEAFQLASKKLDNAAGKGLIHKNVAARQKSRLAKKLNEIQA